MTVKKCLLIAPLSFYSYSEYLKQALTESGYQVTVSNDEYPESTIGKIMGKFRIPLLLSMTRKTIKKKYLDGKKYNLVLIVKGRGVSKELIRNLKNVSPKVIGYTFDSFKYHSAPQKWYNSLDGFYTFDYHDSEKYKIPVIELFSSLTENKRIKKISYDVSAIVRNHSDRLKYIDKVLSNFPTDKKFIYVYEQNIFNFLQNFLRYPLLYLKYRKYIFFKPLPFSEYVTVLQGSNFTIDFAHPKQTGITMRSFEALSTQTKIITNNPFISKYQYFNKENTILFNASLKVDTLIEKVRKIDKTVPKKHNRTIHHFVKQIISGDESNSFSVNAMIEANRDVY